MSVMASHILEFEDSRKSQKPKYFENETLFFLEIKELIHYALRVNLCKKIICKKGNL